MLAAVRPHCPDLRQVLALDSDWERLLANGATVPQAELDRREAALQFDDPINIQYTSGTTGFPKGATLTHHNILNNGYFTALGLGFTEKDRLCIPVPFYHCFGMVLSNLVCTTTGACMVVPSEYFDARGRAGKPSRPSAVPPCTACRRCSATVLDEPDFAPRSLLDLANGHHGRGPCPIELMREVVSRLHMPTGGHRLRHDRDVAALDPQRPSTIRWSSASRRWAG